jgi:thiosulfate dehydrogenase [quinone] large subunit
VWAFLDKTFGLGFSTPSAKAWTHAGSPTKGFLSSVDTGPFQSAYHSIAGTGWADWLFMLGMLGVSIGLIAGVALRASVAAGVLIMAMMWFGNSPSHSTSALVCRPRRRTRSSTTTHLRHGPRGRVRRHRWGLGRVWAVTRAAAPPADSTRSTTDLRIPRTDRRARRLIPSGHARAPLKTRGGRSSSIGAARIGNQHWGDLDPEAPLYGTDGRLSGLGNAVRQR